MKGPEARSSTSCAACRLQKRRCTSNCIFAPHFRSDDPLRFAQVHKVFGASNVSKILNEVPREQRDDTANSLAYEAEARLRDPVYGCIGTIALLQRKRVELQRDLMLARAHLANYVASNSSQFVKGHVDMAPLSHLSPPCIEQTGSLGWNLSEFYRPAYMSDFIGVPFSF